VEKEDGNLQVKNRIYETIFNQDWVKKHQNYIRIQHEF